MPADRTEGPQNHARLFGQQLIRHRTAAGLTQARVAEKSRLSASYISLVERGRANPTLETMAVLANAVGAEVWALVPSPWSLD